MHRCTVPRRPESRAAVFALLALLVTSTAPPLAAMDIDLVGCTRAKAAGSVTGAVIGLHASLSLPPGTVKGALAIWNRCREAGFALPRIEPEPVAVQNLVVRYSRQSDAPGRCGVIQGSLIIIYAYARDERNRIVHCGPPEVNLAHEIGHFLGLQDIAAEGACRSHLMAGVTKQFGAQRTVTSELCSSVSSLWQAKLESSLEDGGEP